jgi:hypothetical protein
MTEHGHPGWYSWLVVIGGAFVSMLISVIIAIQVNNNTLERDRQERAAAERREADRQAANRMVSCAFIEKINQAYQSQYDELTKPGLAIADAWADLRKACP